MIREVTSNMRNTQKVLQPLIIRSRCQCSVHLSTSTNGVAEYGQESSFQR